MSETSFYSLFLCQGQRETLFLPLYGALLTLTCVEYEKYQHAWVNGVQPRNKLRLPFVYRNKNFLSFFFHWRKKDFYSVSNRSPQWKDVTRQSSGKICLCCFNSSLSVSLSFSLSTLESRTCVNSRAEREALEVLNSRRRDIMDR